MILQVVILLSNAGAVYVFEKNYEGQWQQKQKLVAADREAGDSFGSSVSISGEYLVVGAQNESHDLTGGNFQDKAGAAYMFERDNQGKWQQVAKLIASDREKDDHFGSSASIDRNYILIGAYNEDNNPLTPMNDGAGAAYMFERNVSGNWIQASKLTAFDRTSFDQFGTSVSVSINYAVVGAYWDSGDVSGANNLPFAGSAYIFMRDTTGMWIEEQKIVASDREAADYFGISVDISQELIVVGAEQEDVDTTGQTESGAAYIFDKSTFGSWVEKQKIVASDRGNLDFFGNSVSISNQTIVIGAYTEDENIAFPTPSGLNGAGSAYIFSQNNIGDWIQVQKILSSDRQASDYFGSSVSISNNNIIIGTPLEDEDAFWKQYTKCRRLRLHLLSCSSPRTLRYSFSGKQHQLLFR